jgi:hypothetical protein
MLWLQEMDAHIQTQNLQPAPGKTYVVLPPEPEPEPEALFSAKFVVFCIFVIGAGALAGGIQSGQIPVQRYLHLPVSSGSTVSLAPSSATPAPAAHAAPAAVAVPAKVAPAALIAATPAPPISFPAKTFVVSSISIGNPSIAIINGISRVKGDLVETDSVKGWTVRQIRENAVVLQNAATLETIPLSTPELNPLDDTLKPLN